MLDTRLGHDHVLGAGELARGAHLEEASIFSFTLPIAYASLCWFTEPVMRCPGAAAPRPTSRWGAGRRRFLPF